MHKLLHTLASTGYDSDPELTGAHTPQPNPNKRPLTDPVPDFDWNHGTNLEDPSPLKRPKLTGQAHEYHVLGSSSEAGPSTRPGDEVETSPLPNLESPSQWSHSDSESEDEDFLFFPGWPPTRRSTDPELYPDKGKAKESRRVSGTARDVGNAAQRELRPTPPTEKVT